MSSDNEYFDDKQKADFNEEQLDDLFDYFTPLMEEPLSLNMDEKENSVILGRSINQQDKLGLAGTLFIGRICEKNTGYYGLKILIDAINPHKIFISGKTGSGKSYTLGVIAEELADINMNLGVIIVDPMGTYWSMKHETKSETDNKILSKWGMTKKGFSNVKVFFPFQVRDSIVEGTYDDLFSVSPNELTAEDWSNTFGIDYFKSPQSALLSDILNYVKRGYISEKRGMKSRIPPNYNFTIDDMLNCLNYNAVIAEKYRGETIRALKMRLESAKNWGIFSKEGTPLRNLSVPNQISVVDVSYLPDHIRALVVGLLAKKILNERTRISREQKIREMREQADDAQYGIPITWLMLDEAHILVPSKGKTAASDALIEYAKRGRMPGCALVLCTQQPGATNDQILSQIDILINHNLSFTSDIVALKARTPSKLPRKLSDESFLRSLPVGFAIIADQSTTTKRTFVGKIRPRRSEHAGRAVSTKLIPFKSEMQTFDELSTEIISEKEITSKEYITYDSDMDNKLEEKIYENVVFPSFSIPNDVAEDYLNRFIQYQVIDLIFPKREKKLLQMHTRIYNYVDVNLLLNKIVYAMKNIEFNYQGVTYIDNAPIIIYNKGGTILAFIACLTDASTILKICTSVIEEENKLNVEKISNIILGALNKT